MRIVNYLVLVIAILTGLLGLVLPISAMRVGDRVKILPKPSAIIYAEDPSNLTIHEREAAIRCKTERNKALSENANNITLTLEKTDNPKEITDNPNQDLGLKTATITLINIIKPDKPYLSPEVVMGVRVDGLNEVVYICDEDGPSMHGFAIPLALWKLIQSMVGKPLWKSYHMYEADYNLPITKKYAKFIVYGVQLDNNPEHPIGLFVKTTDGRKGYWANTLTVLLKEWLFLNPRSQYPSWSKSIWKSIENGEVKLGMTRAQARMAWGEPKHINTSTGRWGVHEQWVCLFGYLYFENGKLTAIQE